MTRLGRAVPVPASQNLPRLPTFPPGWLRGARGEQPLLLPPVSVRRTELPRPNVVSPASRSQVALRVTELVLWWTRWVRVPQDPSTELTLPGGKGGRGGRQLG